MKKIALLSLLPFILTACLVPEKFTAQLKVKPDQSYTFDYEGTVANFLLVGDGLPDKERAAVLKKTEEEMRAPEVQKIVKKMAYKGKGRYELVLAYQQTPKETMTVLGVFQVATDENGVMALLARTFNQENRRDVEKSGIVIDGTLEVSLPKNATVLSHNATSMSPEAGSYSWRIRDITNVPEMKISFQ